MKLSSQSAELRRKALESAKSKLGIPYIFGQRTIYGCDCVGFLYLVGLDLGWEIDYPTDYRDPRQFYVCEYIDNYFERTETPVPGDILIFKMLGNIPNHAAILYDSNNIIHCVDEGRIPSVRINMLRLKNYHCAYDLTSFQEKTRL